MTMAMWHKFLKIFPSLVLLLPQMIVAQQLTLQQAIDTALRNNFDIRIAKNSAEIAKTNNSYGVAGGLPIVGATAAENVSLSNSNLKFSNGTETNLSKNAENSINAGVSASMVLFNGFKVIATKERLNLLQSQGEILLNQQIQSTIADVMVVYYDIIRQESYLKILQNSLDVSLKKLEIISEKNKVGMANAVLMLQSQTDVNTAEQSLQSQKLVIEQAKADLILLMNSTIRTSFSITPNIEVDSTLQLNEIISYLNRNPQYLSASQQVKIEQQSMKEVSASRYPAVHLLTGYDFMHNTSSKGSTTLNQNFGPSAGITMQVPIFNGNIYKTQKEVAHIRINNSILEKESLLIALHTQANNTYLAYSTNLQQIKSQQKNLEMASQLVDVVMQNFQVSQATILDVKAAQTSYENAAFMLVNLQYAAKVAEINLKVLTYQLGL